MKYYQYKKLQPLSLDELKNKIAEEYTDDYFNEEDLLNIFENDIIERELFDEVTNILN